MRTDRQDMEQSPVSWLAEFYKVWDKTSIFILVSVSRVQILIIF